MVVADLEPKQVEGWSDLYPSGEFNEMGHKVLWETFETDKIEWSMIGSHAFHIYIYGHGTVHQISHTLPTFLKRLFRHEIIFDKEIHLKILQSCNDSL